MKTKNLQQEIERLIRSNSITLNFNGTLYKQYDVDSVSVLNLIPGHFDQGDHRFEGNAKIGIYNTANDKLYDYYNISGIISSSKDNFNIIGTITISKR